MTGPSHRVAGALAICLLAFSIPAYAVSCLIFPLSCLKPKKKYGEEMDAVVLNLNKTRTDVYEVRAATGETVANPMHNTRTWYMWFKVGETLYQAQRDETILQMGYTPKREDWIGKTVTLRFRDQKWMGLKSSWVVFERDKGKEWEFVLISIVGPDGIDECSKFKLCPYQAEVDRAKREEEQLAKRGKTGAKSASDVAPAAIEVPEQASAAVAPEPAAPAAEPAALEPAAASPPAAAEAPATEAPAIEAAPAPETLAETPPATGIKASG